MPNNFELEIFSDLNCIWCYFDSVTIEKIRNAYDIKIIWRAFALHPDIPDEGLQIADLFENDFPLMNDKMQQLEKVANTLGLPLAKRVTISNSGLAQELAKWAETKGALEAYHQAIHKAYFADGLNIADRSVLMDVVKSCKLSRNEALSVIEKRSFSQAVSEDWEKAEKLKILVAPTYILNSDRLVGSQTFEKLEAFLKKHQIKERISYSGNIF